MYIKKSVSKKVYDITDKVIEEMENQGFDYRLGQVNVMYTVIAAFENNENMLIEAGVGIGKSFGYLIPGVLLSFYTGQPLIVASSTIQLTEQLNRDIKIVRKLLSPYLKGRDIKSVVGKGINNYPCICTVQNKLYRTGKKEYADILDRINPGVDRQNPSGIPKKYWKEITKHECISTKGFDRNDCYFYQMRSELTKKSVARDIERIFDPRVLIINQDLLVNNYKNLDNGKPPILPDNPCLLIIDELHNLELKARTALTTEVNLDSYLYTINKISCSVRNDETRRELKKIEKVIKDIAKNITKEVQLEINNNKLFLINEKITITSRNLQVKDTINIVQNILTDFTINNESINPYKNILYENMYADLENLLIFLRAFNNSDNEYVVWAEITNYRKQHYSIYYCPGNIGENLEKHIFGAEISAVGLSATITNKQDSTNPYSYIINNIGFDEKKGSWEYPEESEFNYDNSKLFIPENLPDNRDRGKEHYYDSISRHIANVYLGCKGGCLVLFTAKYDMQMVFKKLFEIIKTDIYLDDEDLTPNEIVKEFENTRGIILSAGSFWEGIDLKGKLLTNLIIVRIPFPVPDPVIENKINRLGNRDLVIVPEMIMKLQQGVGRLIRSKTDIGIVTLLDSRLNLPDYNYASIIYDELPIKNKTTNLKDVKKFQKKNNL